MNVAASTHRAMKNKNLKTRIDVSRLPHCSRTSIGSSQGRAMEYVAHQTFGE